MSILKQSTAATIKLGPFVDDGDGKTAEDGLTISQADIRLSKNGGDIAQSHDSTGATHDELGYYNVPLDATDTDTLGRLRVAVSESGALPVWQDFLVVTANVFDSLFSTDKLDVNAAELGGTAQTGRDIGASVLLSNGTGAGQVSLASGAVLLQATQTGVTIPTVTTVTNAPTDMAKESTLTAIKGAGWNNESILSILNSIAIVGDGSTVGEIYTLLTGLLGAGWTNQTLVALKAVVDAIKAKTDNLPSDPADESSLEAAIAGVSIDPGDIRTAIGLASANLDTQLAGIQADLDNTSQYKADVSGLATAAALTTVDGIVDAIKAKTDNLPSDPADQSILAGAIAALPLASDYTPARAAKLDYLDAAISSRSTSGEGTISWTYTLTASDGVTPITYATVWVTSDAGGTAIEASGQTDAAGQVTFLLNAGTYYVWRKKRGYRFSNPDVEVVV